MSLLGTEAPARLCRVSGFGERDDRLVGAHAGLVPSAHAPIRARAPGFSTQTPSHMAVARP